MKKPVRKKVVKAIKKKVSKKLSRSELERQSILKNLSLISAHLNRIDTAGERLSRLESEGRIAEKVIRRIVDIEGKIERIVSVVERDSSVAYRVEQKIARIEWVHLMLAKVIVPLLQDLGHDRRAAHIEPRYKDEIERMALRATEAGIDQLINGG